MIKYIKKDVCDVERGIVAQGVNCQGVMGSGVAKSLRAKDERIFEQYKTVCDFYARTGDRSEMLGLAHFVQMNGDEHGGDYYVANCFTQEYYGKDGKKYASLDAVKESLLSVLQEAVALKLPVYMPRIGCGLGGLDWDTEVGPALEAALQQVKDDFVIGDDSDVFPQVFVCDL